MADMNGIELQQYDSFYSMKLLDGAPFLCVEKVSECLFIPFFSLKRVYYNKLQIHGIEEHNIHQNVLIQRLQKNDQAKQLLLNDHLPHIVVAPKKVRKPSFQMKIMQQLTKTK